MRKSPDYRYQLLREMVAAGDPPPEEPSLAAMYTVLQGKDSGNAVVEYAHDLHSRRDHQAAMDAFVLSRLAVDAAAKTLGIPKEVIEMYAHLFMDVSVFRNTLELRSFASDYPGDQEGLDLVRTAVFVGPEYLVWMYGGSQTHIDARYIIRKTMVDSYMRSQAHKGNSLTSGVAKEAQKWQQTAVRNAELIEKLDPQTNETAASALKIALSVEDRTFSPDNSPVKIEEILH